MRRGELGCEENDVQFVCCVLLLLLLHVQARSS